jgi:hypothetical protein
MPLTCVFWPHGVKYRARRRRSAHEISDRKFPIVKVGHHSPAQFTFKQGETDMGDKGKKDKGKREQQKTAKLSPKEKRKLKKEKKS